MFGLSLSITGRKSTFSVIWSRVHFSNCELRPVKHLLVPIIQDNLNFSSCLVLLSHHGSLQLTPPPFRKRLCIDFGACAWTSYVTGNIYCCLYLPHSSCLHIPKKTMDNLISDNCHWQGNGQYNYYMLLPHPEIKTAVGKEQLFTTNTWASVLKEKWLYRDQIYWTAYKQHLDNKIPATTDNQPNQD